jgi:hypothetical protein
MYKQTKSLAAARPFAGRGEKGGNWELIGVQ